KWMISGINFSPGRKFIYKFVSLPIIMKGRYVSILLLLLFSGLASSAQKRPVGVVDPAVVERARQAGPNYQQWSAMERSLTLLNNQEGLVPVRDVLPGRIAAVSIVSNDEFQATREKKDDHFNTFLDHIANYTPANLFVLPNDTTA